MDGFQVHLGATSEILIRVSLTSWALGMGGGRKRKQTGRSQTDANRTAGKQFCMHSLADGSAGQVQLPFIGVIMLPVVEKRDSHTEAGRLRF